MQPKYEVTAEQMDARLNRLRTLLMSRVPLLYFEIDERERVPSWKAIRDENTRIEFTMEIGMYYSQELAWLVCNQHGKPQGKWIWNLETDIVWPDVD